MALTRAPHTDLTILDFCVLLQPRLLLWHLPVRLPVLRLPRLNSVVSRPPPKKESSIARPRLIRAKKDPTMSAFATTRPVSVTAPTVSPRVTVRLSVSTRQTIVDLAPVDTPLVRLETFKPVVEAFGTITTLMHGRWVGVGGLVIIG